MKIVSVFPFFVYQLIKQVVYHKIKYKREYKDKRDSTNNYHKKSI